jgi:hypothetical protein
MDVSDAPDDFLVNFETGGNGVFVPLDGALVLIIKLIKINNNNLIKKFNIKIN